MKRRPSTPMTWRWWVFFSIAIPLAIMLWGYLIVSEISLKRQFAGRATIQYFGTVFVGKCHETTWWGHVVHYTYDYLPKDQNIVGSRACWNWKKMRWAIDGWT